MRSGRHATVCALALIMTACRPDTVALTYEFTPGSTLSYRMTAAARARWDIGGPGKGSYRVTFDVAERIESVQDDRAVVAVTMTPTDVEEMGLPSPGAKPRSFSLLVGPSGEVLEILEVDEVAATALDPDELAFIGTYRPPLPLEPVRLKDTWTSRQGLSLGQVAQEISTVGVLDRLGKDAKGETASIVYRGDGPLRWTTALAQGIAKLSANARSSATAVFDIDDGYLRFAESRTEGSFDVTVAPEDGRAPLEGTLELELQLELERIEG